QAQAYLDEVKRELIHGVADPTRVVLVGHSHGTVWASLLALNNLDVTFDAFISLDAICWQWWGRHKGFIAEAFVDSPWPLPFPLDKGDPCGTFEVPGVGKVDVNDVVSANVIYGLEARTHMRLLSFDPNVLADDDPNVRINGTTTNIWGISAREAHSDLGRYYNQSIGWITAMITALGLPDHAEYPMHTFVLPPAREEFDYQPGTECAAGGRPRGIMGPWPGPSPQQPGWTTSTPAASPWSAPWCSTPSGSPSRRRSRPAASPARGTRTSAARPAPTPCARC